MKKVITTHYCDRCSTPISGQEINGMNNLKIVTEGIVYIDPRYPEKVTPLSTEWKDLCQVCRVAMAAFFKPRALEPKLSEINKAREFFQTLLNDRDEKDRPTYAANSVLFRAYTILSTGANSDRNQS